MLEHRTLIEALLTAVKNIKRPSTTRSVNITFLQRMARLMAD